MHKPLFVKAIAPALRLVVFPIAAFLASACGGAESGNGESYVVDAAGTAAEQASSPLDSEQRITPTPEAGAYRGPTVGAAVGFSALAHSAITTTAPSFVTGNLGVSGAPTRSITGFDPLLAPQYGTDSNSPHSLRTILTQREVDALVDDIDVRACDADYADLTRSGTGEVTLHPGVTCLNGSGADLLLAGRVTLDAGGDPNAFFIIRSNFTLTAQDSTKLVLANGAQACSVFWRVSEAATIGRSVDFLGTVVAGTGITMQSGSTLIGRALAQTTSVTLDGNPITIPVYAEVGSDLTCSHVQ
jgi:hypothetical protein